MNFVLFTNSKFETLANRNIRNLERLGYSYKLYLRREESRFEMCRNKPGWILEHLETYNKPLVYIDVDAFILEPIDEMFDEEFDVGLTYRGANRRYVNAGVMCFRPTDAAKNFLKIWIDRLPSIEILTEKDKKKSGDQLYLNQLLDEHLGRSVPLLNTNQDMLGTNIRFFDSRIYNCTEIRKHKNLTQKVVHGRLEFRKAYHRVFSKVR